MARYIKGLFESIRMAGIAEQHLAGMMSVSGVQPPVVPIRKHAVSNVVPRLWRIDAADDNQRHCLVIHPRAHRLVKHVSLVRHYAVADLTAVQPG